MADIRTENIIMNLTTQKNELIAEIEKTAKAITSLEADTKKASKESDKAFDEMAKSAKSYADQLVDAQTKQKNLSRTIQEQQKITVQFKSELLQVETRLKGIGANTVQFQRLTKEANNLKTAIKDNNLALQNLKLDKSQIDNNVKDLTRMAAAAKTTSGGLRNVKDELTGIAQSATQVSGPLGNITGIISRLGPVGAIAAAGIGVISAAFINAKNTIQEFGDDVDVFMSRYEFRWRKFKDNLAEGFVKTVTQFDAEEFFKGGGFDDQARLAEQRKQQKIKDKEDEDKFVKLKQDEFDLEDLKIDNIKKLAELERDRIGKISEFEQKRSNQNIVDKSLIIDAEKLINEEYDLRIKIQTEENRILSERKKLLKSGREDRRTEQENETKILQIEIQRDNLIKEIQERKRIQNKEAKKEKEDAVGILNVLRAQIAEVQKAKNEALTFEEIIQKERAIFELEKMLKEMEDVIDAFKARLKDTSSNEPVDLLPTLGIFSSVRLAETTNEIQANISSLQKKLANTKLGTEEFFKLKNEIERLQELLKNEGLLPKPTLTERPETNTGKSETELFLEEANEKVQVYGNMTRELIAMDIERKDRQIELQKERLQEFRRIAEQGNAEQLQLEEERLAKLIEARERYAQRDRAIAALQIVAANAVSIAKGIEGVITGFGKGTVAGIANAVALAATIGSTILAVRQTIGTIPAFAEGIEDTGKTGRGVDGKGGFHAILHSNERVMTKDQNRKLGKRSNEEIVRMVKLAEIHEANNRRIVGGNHRSDNNFQSNEITAKLERTNRLLENLHIEANVNEFGLSAGIKRANGLIKRRQNLAR